MNSIIEKKPSKNELAKKICGLRDNPEGSLTADFPIDFGYICPKCGSESLEWSEYNTFCWCPVCNKDFPTCICIPELSKATDIYLQSVKTIKELL
jgi:hypothetical protein